MGDQRAIAMRSKEWLVHSLFSLLKRKKYADITISEIALHADLDRRTFYRHFKSKEDVISYFIEITGREYETALCKNAAYDNKAIAEAFFTVCYSQKESLLILNKQNLLYLLLAELNRIFPEYQRKYAMGEELNHPHRDYLLAYHIGGFWNLLLKWLKNGCKETPLDMAEIVNQLIQSKQI